MSEEVAVSENADWLARYPGDRRRATLRSFAYGAMTKGRRRGPRRREEYRSHYVDRYDPRLFVVAVGIFTLCCLDALLTLMLLSMGAEEVNPLMAALIDRGVETFVYTKLAITAFGILYLVLHARFSIGGAIRVSHALYAVFGSYMVLFVYQVSLLSRVI